MTDARIRELSANAMRLLAAGDRRAALAQLDAAVALNPADPVLRLNQAAARRATADLAGAMSAVDAALAIDPRMFLGLLMKGSIQERAGFAKDAAQTYGLALTQAPPDDQLDPPTRQATRRARDAYGRYRTELAAAIRHDLGADARNASAAERRRVDAFVDLMLGQRRNFRQEPTDYFYPGLPAIEFYDREEFPWLEAFEAETETFQRELAGVMGEDRGFEPYVQYPDGVPLDQWAELNRSRRWSAFHFFHYGRRYEANCQRCPQTVAALQRLLPQPQVQGRMPAAMFSVLRPRTRIPPHTGVANIRLVVHLPLVVPPGCAFRVGNETRPWKIGEAWVFDDTIEHEAWNDSDEDRVVLICDIWNPRLSAAERALIADVLVATDRFNGRAPETPL